MKIIIGTYRADKAMIDRCLSSIIDHLSDTEPLEFWFVDDSADDDFRGWLETFGNVVGLGRDRQGYTKAMDRVCKLMRTFEDDYVTFWEEDFVAVRRVALDLIRAELQRRPQLAQIVLPRQPWFPNEIEAGSMMQALADRKNDTYSTRLVPDALVPIALHIHTMTFSCNPAVWAPMAYRWPWPQCGGSEDEKTRYLREDDKALFAFWGDEVLVHHDGERVGHGY
ncbi:glycosyltransferase [Mycobacterium phage RoMag]|nr:glycosyltransferase [Mycobacterium phage Kamryn]QAY26900.1 glycosyltransferase [Mycobacterium phage RoMag]QPL13542.1 glycosyltransferase [Mycobacterium phage StephanieG]UVD40513.1 glycosyltransferase [Mycobacterium phage IkeLoa]